MANPADVKGTWQKSGVRIALTDSITSGPVPEWVLLETNFGVTWPSANKPLVHHGMHASGKAISTSQDVTLGRENPMLTLQLPLTSYAVTILTCSLLQDENWTLGSLQYQPQVFDDHVKSVATMFLYAEVGLASGAVYKCKGGVVTRLKVNLPAVDSDLGKATLEADIMFASVTRATSFSGAGTLDPGTPLLTSQHVVSIDAGVAPFVSASFEMTNGAAKGMNAASTPDHITVGPFGLSGNLDLLFTNSNADDWGDLEAGHEAKTVFDLLVSVGSTYSMDFDVLFGAPSKKDQGNVYVVSFPFEPSYVDATRPAFTFDHASDLFNWAA